MKYRVALEQSEEGFCVWVPGLPGCVSQGRTEEEALENTERRVFTRFEVMLVTLGDYWA